MDKKEVSFILANIDRRVCDDELNEALDMAIKALEQEPKTDSWSIKDVADTFKKHGLIRVQEPCGDAISRQAVLDMVEDMTDQFGNKHKVVTEGMISLLPPVTPLPKAGHWIKTSSGFKCSKCLIVHSHTSLFCQSCGAKMIEPQEKR